MFVDLAIKPIKAANMKLHLTIKIKINNR